MLEVKAKLTRLPVYFANEVVNCVITLTNNSSSDELEQLAWCVVQIHCFMHIDENKIQIPVNQKDGQSLKVEQVINNFTNRDTAFHPLKDERGRVVFSTDPKFLFCDLKLASNESQVFYFNDQLPDHSPPSYHGQALKYYYKITIGIQRVNSTIQLLRMPIKLLNLPKDTEIDDCDSQIDKLNTSQNITFNHHHQQQDENTSSTSESTNEINQTNLQVSNNHNNKSGNIINLILHKLDYLSSRRTLSSYIITNHLGKVGKFCIFKSVFKLGEDIIGFFDFSDSEIPCVQFTVTLQSEEIINDDYKSNKLKNNKTLNTSQLTNYSECQEFCIHEENAQISLPIPLTITSTFETNIIKLRWRLYFEFVTTKPEELSNREIYEDETGRMELSPKSMNVQTMIWDLPITILPTNPSKIGQGLQLPDTSIIVV